jgi:hypothetical protein
MWSLLFSSVFAWRFFKINAEKRRRLEAAIERDVRRGRRNSEDSHTHENEEEGLPRTLRNFTPFSRMTEVRDEIEPLTKMSQEFLEKVILYARIRKKKISMASVNGEKEGKVKPLFQPADTQWRLHIERKVTHMTKQSQLARNEDASEAAGGGVAMLSRTDRSNSIQAAGAAR